jgi:hypothetical protein
LRSSDSSVQPSGGSGNASWTHPAFFCTTQAQHTALARMACSVQHSTPAWV